MRNFFALCLLVTSFLSCSKQGADDNDEQILCALPPPKLSLRLVHAETGADLIAGKQLDTAAVSIVNEKEEKFKYGIAGNDTLKVLVVPQFSYREGDNRYVLKAAARSVPITVNMIYGKCGEYIGAVTADGVKASRDTRGFYLIKL